MSLGSSRIVGWLAGSPGTGSKTYEPNRPCRHGGCRTRLSIYNPHDACWMHFGAEQHTAADTTRRAS
jgi:hypothetical protein